MAHGTIRFSLGLVWDPAWQAESMSTRARSSLILIFEAAVVVTSLLLVIKLFVLGLVAEAFHVANSAVSVVVTNAGEVVNGVFGVEIATADLLVLLDSDNAIFLLHHNSVEAVSLLNIAVVAIESALVAIARAGADLGVGTRSRLSVAQSVVVLDVIAVGLAVVGSDTVSASVVVVGVLRGVELQQSQ